MSDPPPSALEVGAGLEVSVEPNPVRAGQEAQLRVASGLTETDQIATYFGWACWDGSKWAGTHLLFAEDPPRVHEGKPGTVVTVNGGALGLPAEIAIRIPDVDPGTYRLSIPEEEGSTLVQVAVTLPQNNGGNDISMEVVVRADQANRCVGLEYRGEPYTVLWFPGTSATFDPFLLYDESGTPVAENGDRIRMAGGVVVEGSDGPCGGDRTILAGALSAATNLTNPNRG